MRRGLRVRKGFRGLLDLLGLRVRWGLLARRGLLVLLGLRALLDLLGLKGLP